MASVSQLSARLGGNPTVLALSAARLGDAVGNSILFIVIPLYVAKLPAPWLPLPEPTRVGILISMYGLIFSLLQPVGGALTDRAKNRKAVILLGLGITGAGMLVFVAASRFSHLLLLRALQGFGVALTIPASLSIMASATDRSSRGGSMGIYTSMRMVGFSIGPVLGGYLLDHVGFDAAFYVGAGFIALAMVLVQAWVRESGDRDVSMEARAKLAPSVWRSPVVPLGAATFVMAAAFSMLPTLEKQFNARLHQGAFGFGLAFSSLMLSRLLFQFPLGRLSDRIGRKPLVVGGLLLMGAVTAPLGLVATTAQLTGLRVLQGIASAGIAAPAFALAADLSSRGGEGRQMSVITMGFGLGIALGPLLAGVLAPLWFDLPFLLGGLSAIPAAWIVQRWVPETVSRS
ncbi:MAG: MFS transporter [Myxococcales bacterium]|nr:MFS transporter [Myxococcales bacterium]MCB9581565.1 MFS transporter [Polyangiaceae bacterium]